MIHCTYKERLAQKLASETKQVLNEQKMYVTVQPGWFWRCSGSEDFGAWRVEGLESGFRVVTRLFRGGSGGKSKTQTLQSEGLNPKP